MNYRLSKGTTARYTSFEEVAKAFGRKPVRKQTTDKTKLAKQRKYFLSRHICEACHNPMTYVGGNMMVCTCDECKGIKHEKEVKETAEIRTWYSTSFELLDDKGAMIASNLFA